MTFQHTVWQWFLNVFPQKKYKRVKVRNQIFLEEALELVQSTGFKKKDCYKLIEYVYSRPKGRPYQEVGGVLVTLATLCEICGINMTRCGEVELERISSLEVIEKIRSKQKEKNDALRS